MIPTLSRFAPAKINLFLEVIGRRPDGYHDLVTVMETIAIGDTVEVTPAAELSVVTNRADVPSGEGNVAYKIVRAAEAALGRPLPAHVAITKRLPPGSGLGAGSSDAVAALRLVLDLHGVVAGESAQSAIAASVGSDTAFFLNGGVACCTGRGEIVTPVAARGLRHVVVVLPAAPCATSAVYAALARAPREGGKALVGPVIAAIEAGAALGQPVAFNRLEAAAFLAYPELVDRRARLREIAGAEPLLSGSGGSFFFLASSQAAAALLAARLRAADPSLDVRATASYR